MNKMETFELYNEYRDDVIVFKSRVDLEKALFNIESNINFIVTCGQSGKLIISDVLLSKIKNGDTILIYDNGNRNLQN